MPKAHLKSETVGAAGSALDGSAAELFVRIDAPDGLPAWPAKKCRRSIRASTGRITSALLTRGRPEQLDLCNAWRKTIDQLGEAGFRNRISPLATA